MESKVCKDCKQNKQVSEFFCGQARCKACTRVWDREQYKTNPKRKEKRKRQALRVNERRRTDKEFRELDNARKREWYKTSADKEKCRENCRRHRAKRKAARLNMRPEPKHTYSEEYKARKRNRKRERWISDINFKLASVMRSRLYQALAGYVKQGSAVKDLGCSIEELKQHLESKFTTDMRWENYGNRVEQWSIDHIVPLSRFNLNDRQHFILANYYLNLQPMWHLENISKGNREIVLIATS